MVADALSVADLRQQKEAWAVLVFAPRPQKTRKKGVETNNKQE